MENMKKFMAAVVAGAAAAPIGWYFPAFGFACVGAFLVVAGVHRVAARNRPQVATTVSGVPAVVLQPVVAVDSVDGMLIVPVRPATHHQPHAA